MARPQTISDDDLLERVRACILEHGPAVPLSVVSAAAGLSAPALLKRFGSKERLVFRALLPSGPPRWWDALVEAPTAEPHSQLAGALVAMCEDFSSVGPALAALRMSRLEVDRMFPPGRPGPAILARMRMADWLRRAGVGDGCEVLADAAVGAAEARGFLRWVGPQMVTPADDRVWAEALAEALLPGHP